MNIEELQSYSDAWNAHDIEKIMRFMSAECVFETGGGGDKYGSRYVGHDEVKSRFMSVWKDFPDVHFENLNHFVDGDRGCSEWTFVATKPDGSRIEINGCDLFTFAQGKIKVKSTFLKHRT